MHKLRPLALALALVGCVMTTAVAQAAEPAPVSAPAGVTVSVPALTAMVSWQPAEPQGLLGYRVDVLDTSTATPTASEQVGPDVVSVAVEGLPRWDEQAAQVTALYTDGAEEASTWSDPFWVLSTVTMVNNDPIVQHGDGVCCETYSMTRRFRLDAPMPVDVWLRPTVISFDGSSAHDGFDQTDERWPAAVDDAAILVPAGSTTGTYTINWWGDDWKRFEYANYVFGFEGWQHPLTGGAPVHLDQARQSFSITEDDPSFWPEVAVDPTTSVEAGDTARVKVHLNVPAPRDTVLTYKVKDGTARAGRDYTAVGTAATVRKGQRVVWVKVPTRRHRGTKGDSQFSVRVTGARAQQARLTSRQRSLVSIRYSNSGDLR